MSLRQHRPVWFSAVVVLLVSICFSKGAENETCSIRVSLQAGNRHTPEYSLALKLILDDNNVPFETNVEVIQESVVQEVITIVGDATTQVMSKFYYSFLPLLIVGANPFLFTTQECTVCDGDENTIQECLPTETLENLNEFHPAYSTMITQELYDNKFLGAGIQDPMTELSPEEFQKIRSETIKPFDPEWEMGSGVKASGILWLFENLIVGKFRAGPNCFIGGCETLGSADYLLLSKLETIRCFFLRGEDGEDILEAFPRLNKYYQDAKRTFPTLCERLASYCSNSSPSVAEECTPPASLLIEPQSDQEEDLVGREENENNNEFGDLTQDPVQMTYFKIRGRPEAMRMFAFMKGKPLNETFISQSEWDSRTPKIDGIMNGNLVFGNLPVISDASYLPKQILDFHDETGATKVSLPFLGQSFSEFMHVQARLGDDEGLQSNDAAVRADAYRREWYTKVLPYWKTSAPFSPPPAAPVEFCYRDATIADVVETSINIVLHGEELIQSYPDVLDVEHPGLVEVFWLATLEDILCWTPTILDSPRSPQLKKFYTDMRQKKFDEYLEDPDRYSAYRSYIVSSCPCEPFQYPLNTGEYFVEFIDYVDRGYYESYDIQYESLLHNLTTGYPPEFSRVFENVKVNVESDDDRYWDRTSGVFGGYTTRKVQPEEFVDASSNAVTIQDEATVNATYEGEDENIEEENAASSSVGFGTAKSSKLAITITLFWVAVTTVAL